MPHSSFFQSCGDWTTHSPVLEADAYTCSVKKVLLEISQNS